MMQRRGTKKISDAKIVQFSKWFLIISKRNKLDILYCMSFSSSFPLLEFTEEWVINQTQKNKSVNANKYIRVMEKLPLLQNDGNVVISFTNSSNTIKSLPKQQKMRGQEKNEKQVILEKIFFLLFLCLESAYISRQVERWASSVSWFLKSSGILY